MSGKPTELLDPRITSESSKDRLVRTMLQSKPEIQRLGRSSVLDEVRDIFVMEFICNTSHGFYFRSGIFCPRWRMLR